MAATVDVRARRTAPSFKSSQGRQHRGKVSEQSSSRRMLLMMNSAHESVMQFREFVVWSFLAGIDMVLSWLIPHRDSFRKKKLELETTAIGTPFIRRLQIVRHPFLDHFFMFVSYFADQEFYLTMVPYMFWSGDAELARHMTFIIVGGLLCGNLLKEIFQLARPQGVFTPPALRKADSAALADFGFPSTHAMNSISNPLCLYIYWSELGYWNDDAATVSESQFKLLALCWMFTISIARIYLGVHSVLDVLAGHVVGISYALLYMNTRSVIDDLIFNGTNILPFYMLVSLIVLFFSPRPNPPTPTFAENAFLLGLASGCACGVRAWVDLNGSGAVDAYFAGSEFFSDVKAYMTELGSAMPYFAGTTRFLVGLVVLLVVRQLFKDLVTAVVSYFGARTKIAAHQMSPTDLWGAAAVKYFCYLQIAFSITIYAPVCFRALGIQGSY